MALANIAITNTWDQLRVRFNQALVVINDLLEGNTLSTGTITITNPSSFQNNISLNVFSGIIKGDGGLISNVPNSSITGTVKNSQLQNSTISIVSNSAAIVVSGGASTPLGNTIFLNASLSTSPADQSATNIAAAQSVNVVSNIVTPLLTTVPASFDQANSAYGQANAAYSAANNATSNIANNGTIRSTQRQLNFRNGLNTVINVENDSGGSRANITINTTGLLANTDGAVFSGSLNITSNLSAQNVRVTGNLTNSVGGIYGTGKATVQVGASAMVSDTVNGPEAINFKTNGGNMFFALAFDPTVEEKAFVTLNLPKSWNKGAITFIPYFSQKSSGSGSVCWNVAAAAISSGATLDPTYGSNTMVVVSAGTANVNFKGAESAIVSIGGNPTASNNKVILRVSRAAAHVSDTLGQDARLDSIDVLYVTNNLTDD